MAINYLCSWPFVLFSVLGKDMMPKTAYNVPKYIFGKAHHALGINNISEGYHMACNGNPSLVSLDLKPSPLADSMVNASVIQEKYYPNTMIIEVFISFSAMVKIPSILRRHTDITTMNNKPHIERVSSIDLFLRTTAIFRYLKNCHVENGIYLFSIAPSLELMARNYREVNSD